MGVVVSPTASPMSAAPMNPADGIGDGIAGRDDRARRAPRRHAAAAEDREVGQPVAGFHDERV